MSVGEAAPFVVADGENTLLVGANSISGGGPNCGWSWILFFRRRQHHRCLLDVSVVELMADWTRPLFGVLRVIDVCGEAGAGSFNCKGLLALLDDCELFEGDDVVAMRIAS